MAVLTTAGFSELLYPGLKAIWGISYSDYPEEYTKIFEVKTSDKAYEKTVGLTGFGTASVKAQGGSVSYDDAYQGYTQTLTHSTYGIGFIVTSEMYEDDQYGKINALPRALARSVRHTVEIAAANVLNRGFNSTYTGADGKELLATDHPLVGGGTEQNELTTAADLSMTSLEQAMIDIGDLTDERGLIIAAKPRMLIVPPELDWTARQLLGSEKDPETNFNAINPAKGLMPFTVNHYLTDSDAWFIKTDVPEGMVFYWRRRPAFTKDNDFDSDNGKYKSTFRFSVGWDDYRGIFGAPGA